MNRLEKIKKTHLERIKQNEFYTASFIHVDWLIEQAEKANELEQKLKDSESRVHRLSVKYRYEREERVPKLEEEIKKLKSKIIEAFHNWALGNFDDERFHADIQILVHNLENEE